MQLEETQHGRRLAAAMDFLPAEEGGSDLLHYRRNVAVIGMTYDGNGRALGAFDAHGRALAAPYDKKLYMTIGTFPTATAVGICTLLGEGHAYISAAVPVTRSAQMTSSPVTYVGDCTAAEVFGCTDWRTNGFGFQARMQ